MHIKVNASKGKHVKVGRFIPRINRTINIQEHANDFIGSGVSTVCREGRFGKVILITNCPVKAIIASGKIKSDFFPRLTILGKTKAGKVVYETTRCEPICSSSDLEPESALLYHEIKGTYEFSDVYNRKHIPYQVQQDFITIKKELDKLGYEKPTFDAHKANLMRLGDKLILTDPIHEGYCSSKKHTQKTKLYKYDRRKKKERLALR